MDDRVIRIGALAVPLMVAGAVQAGVVTSDGPDIVLKTDSGFTAQTADGAFKFDLGGRIMFDLDSADGIYNQTDNGMNSERMEFRRIRVEMKGTAYKDWHYVIKTELADGTGADENGGANTIDEVSITYTGWDFADFTAGRFNMPFGLEQLTSSKWTSTPERTILYDFLNANGKQQAIQLSGDFAEMFGWQVALVDAEKFDGSDGSKEFAHAARMTFSPVHEDGSVLHFGLAYFDANANLGTATEDTVFRTRMGVHTTEDGGGAGLRPRVRADLNHDETIGLEAAGVFGPFSVQGEYFTREMDVAGSTLSPENKGYYLQGTWTLTGESRIYKWKDGKFDAIKPKGKNGAWELVAKYESVESDLDSAAVRDIEIELLTLGVNWYVNNNVRVMLHYLDLDTDGLDTVNAAAIPGAYTVSNFPAAGSDEDGNAVSARLQYVF